jgi:vacuolar-type H+-ATPase subunit E/Vma4
MSQNTLIEKIKHDADQTVTAIKAQGASDIENIKRAAETELAELKTTYETELAKKKAQLELVAISKAKQAGNIAVQMAKREQIDALFDAVADELAHQPTAEYVQCFTSFVQSIVPAQTEAIRIIAPKERTVETATILSNAGLSGTVHNDAEFTAGLIVEARDGVYDITLERLLKEKRPELEMMIVNRVNS